MRRVCAWCNKILGEEENYAAEGCVTHGICSVCAIRITNFKTRTANEILSLIIEPIFVLDTDGRVQAVNNSGKKMLGKDSIEIEDKLGGDAFECSYAKLDGGCGNTVHCKTCTIRNIIMDTLSTGQGYLNVPAFQSINTNDGTKILKFRISTEKVENCVLLRIEEVTERTA